MKQVELVISSIVDMDPIEVDPEGVDRTNDKVRLRVWMTDEQIAYNRMVLLDQQTKDRGIPKIRMVK